MNSDDFDRLQISERRHQERLAAMEEVRARETLDVWPSSCPTCFAEPGERCMTRTGKRYGGRHTTRPRTGSMNQSPKGGNA